MLLKILNILLRYLYYLNKSLEVIEMIISHVISVLKKQTFFTATDYIDVQNSVYSMFSLYRKTL